MNNSIVGWLAQNIPLHLDWCKTFRPADGLTREQVIEAWVRWGLATGCLQVFYKEQSPDGYIFARPSTVLRIYETQDYFGTLFEFDRGGNVAWIDTLWAPGLYHDVLEWLRATGRKYVGWQHKGRYYLKEISLLSGDKPLKSQIADALIDPQSLGLGLSRPS